jgi:hypothetical protein
LILTSFDSSSLLPEFLIFHCLHRFHHSHGTFFTSVDVAVLTKPEIRKDMREIQRSLHADSDSDCSVDSLDVLHSEYPVKPRKTPRWHQSHHDQDSHGASRGGADGSGADRVEFYDPEKADATIAYIKNIERTHPDLSAKEQERAVWDQKRQSYQASVANASKRIHTERKEQEYYFRVLQSAHFRSLLLQSAQSKQNTMMWDVLQSLRRRKMAAEVIDSELLKIKQLYSNAKPMRNSTKGKGKGGGKGGCSTGSGGGDGDEPPEGASAVVRVHLRHSGQEVVIYRGQWVATPMGEGCVERIFPREQKVHIRVGFGMLYAHLPRMIYWGLSSAMVAEDGTQLPVASSSSSTESGAMNMDVSSSSNDPAAAVSSSSTDVGDGLDLSGDRALMLHWKVMEQRLNMPSAASRGISQALAPIIAAEGADLYAEGTVGERSELYGHKTTGTTTTAAAEDMEVDPERDHRALSALSESNSGDGSNMTAMYHIPLTYDPKRSRQAMRRSLVISEPNSLLREPMLLMTAPANLPHFAQAKIMSGNADLYLNADALSGTSNASTQHCTTSSLTWEANTDAMQQKMDERGLQILQWERELDRVQAAVSSMRRTSAKLASETSATRMKMFTRRIRHRNTLLEHGIDLANNTLPPNLQPGGEGGNQEAIAAMLADIEHTGGLGDSNDKEPSTQPGAKGGKGWAKNERRDRSDHQVIEIGGQIIGKPGGRGKPPGWGTAQGRYSSGGSIPIPGIDELRRKQVGSSSSSSVVEQSIESNNESASESGGGGGSKKRARIVEADWLAANPVVTGKRERGNRGDAAAAAAATAAAAVAAGSKGSGRDDANGGAFPDDSAAGDGGESRSNKRGRNGRGSRGGDDDGSSGDSDDEEDGEGQVDDADAAAATKKSGSSNEEGANGSSTGEADNDKQDSNGSTMAIEDNSGADADVAEGAEDEEEEEDPVERGSAKTGKGSKRVAAAAAAAAGAKAGAKSARSDPKAKAAAAKKPPAKRSRR